MYLFVGPGGFCIRAPPGQPGELVGRIDSKDPMKRFDGYSSKAATEKKVKVLTRHQSLTLLEQNQFYTFVRAVEEFESILRNTGYLSRI